MDQYTMCHDTCGGTLKKNNSSNCFMTHNVPTRIPRLLKISPYNEKDKHILINNWLYNTNLDRLFLWEVETHNRGCAQTVWYEPYLVAGSRPIVSIVTSTALIFFINSCRWISTCYLNSSLLLLRPVMQEKTNSS